MFRMSFLPSSFSLNIFKILFSPISFVCTGCTEMNWLSFFLHHCSFCKFYLVWKSRTFAVNGLLSGFCSRWTGLHILYSEKEYYQVFLKFYKTYLTLLIVESYIQSHEKNAILDYIDIYFYIGVMLCVFLCVRICNFWFFSWNECEENNLIAAIWMYPLGL